MSAFGSNPSGLAFAATPHDSTDESQAGRAFYVGGAGNVSAVGVSGDAVTFTAVPAGAIIPLRVKRINSTGTTATDIVILT